MTLRPWHVNAACIRPLFWVLLLWLTGGVSAHAQDNVLTIEGTRIRGDQESPTVLYLVPWQAPLPQGLERPGADFMVDRAIEPLERAGFQRLLGYHQRFQAVHAPGAPKNSIDARK